MKRIAALFLSIACSTPSLAVDFSFDTEIQHSKSWFDWADCGDYPGLSLAPENVHMAWHGTLSFDPPARAGWFTTTSFAFASDRTSPGDFNAYVSGFYAPGGFVTLFIDFPGSGQYADAVLTLPIVAAVPEPAEWALLLLGVGAFIARRRVLP